MRIVHLVSFDFGGAAIAAMRINEALQNYGENSCIIVGEKRNSDSDVISYSNDKIHFFWRKICGGVTRLLSGTVVSFSPIGVTVHNYSQIKDADVIFIHWTNKFLSIKEIKRIVSSKKTVIFVLHDMWWFTGGCHYDKECGGYKQGCKQCKNRVLSIITSIQYKKKKSILQKENVLVVAPCEWMLNCCKSACGHLDRIYRIPFPIDINKYTCKRLECNEKRDIKRILFGAYIYNDERKGMDLLYSALRLLNPNDFELIVYGHGDEKVNLQGFRVNNIGYVESEDKMVEILSTIDVSVVPSRQENYANVVMESLACGVPVVAFSIGGMPDFIKHRKNGYLARPFDVNDLAEGIMYCAKNSFELGREARQQVEHTNLERIVAEQYVAIIDKMN